MSERVFLTAEWRHLMNFTFAVDPALLEPHLPDGCALARWQGKSHVSAVAFDFRETRVLGVKVPWHINFPELNLRFYVESKDPHGRDCVGVVFIREYVPRHAIAWAARFGYNEPYRTIPMRSKVTREGGRIEAVHDFSRRPDRLRAAAPATPRIAAEDTAEHFFKEHEWGFGRTRAGQTLVYRVEHPVWESYPVDDYEIDVDFGRLYGPAWSFLNDATPEHVVFAEGSPIKVYFPLTRESAPGA